MSVMSLKDLCRDNHMSSFLKIFIRYLHHAMKPPYQMCPLWSVFEKPGFGGEIVWNKLYFKCIHFSGDMSIHYLLNQPDSLHLKKIIKLVKFKNKKS